MPVISRRNLVPLTVGGVALLAVALGAAYWWSNKQTYETTDNAFIQADTVSVSPLVEGYVAEVMVDDNQTVSPNQVLVRIDPATIQTRLAQAEANAQALDAAVRAVDDKSNLEQAVIAQRAAAVQSARASAQLADAEMQRYGSLEGAGWVSTQRVQTARAAAAQAAAAVTQAEAALEAERRTAQSLGSARAQTLAQAAAAKAAVDQARIDLSRTEIRAPIHGVVGARAVRPGQYVRAGTTMMSIVPVGQAYVVANFKETQVGRLRIGQAVEIKADAFGRKAIKGRVDSFSPATGSEFALIPVENAVGNFTKIVQRLPVKIAVDRADPLAGALRPGLSVHVRVDITADTGPSFAESGPAGRLASRAPTP